jgi:hypothetical protein
MECYRDSTWLVSTIRQQHCTKRSDTGWWQSCRREAKGLFSTICNTATECIAVTGSTNICTKLMTGETTLTKREKVAKTVHYTLNSSDPRELHHLELGSLPRLLPSRSSSDQRRTGCNSAMIKTLWNSTTLKQKMDMGEDWRISSFHSSSSRQQISTPLHNDSICYFLHSLQKLPRMTGISSCSMVISGNGRTGS